MNTRYDIPKNTKTKHNHNNQNATMAEHAHCLHLTESELLAVNQALIASWNASTTQGRKGRANFIHNTLLNIKHQLKPSNVNN